MRNFVSTTGSWPPWTTGISDSKRSCRARDIPSANAGRGTRSASTDQEGSGYVTTAPSGRPRPESRVRRILLVLVGGVAAFVAAAGPAAAHTELISSTPADQQTVSRTPAVVALTFSESVLPMGTQVVVTGPEGPVQVGAPKVADSTVSQDLQGGSPAGQYTVAWRVTADDGHPLSGTLSFTAEAASDGGSATRGPSDAPSSDEKAASTRAPTWIWIFGGVALLVVVGVVARQLTRRTDISPPS